MTTTLSINGIRVVVYYDILSDGDAGYDHRLDTKHNTIVVDWYCEDQHARIRDREVESALLSDLYD